MDPQYPCTRLSLIPGDTAPVLLNTRDQVATLPTFGGNLVLLDEFQDEFNACQSDSPCRPGSGSDLAYVIYNSVSTGDPRGTRIMHQELESTPTRPQLFLVMLFEPRHFHLCESEHH